MAGYHYNDITKGKFGEFSKIVEEFEELVDANEQKNPIMVLQELSDMVGAMEAYTTKYYNITLQDVIRMSAATKRAFESGDRGVDLSEEDLVDTNKNVDKGLDSDILQSLRNLGANGSNQTS